MAHSAIHFATGAMIGAVMASPSVVRTFFRGKPLARAVARWLLCSNAVGLYAVVPSVLRYLGCPEHLCRSKWLSVFIFHPQLASLHLGTIWATAALVICFALQYAGVLTALAVALRRQHLRPHPNLAQIRQLEGQKPQIPRKVCH